MAGWCAQSLLLEQVRTTIERHRMFDRGAGIVIGVSGGPDSVALLHALNRLKSELGCWLVAAHLDHALRPDSSEDADFVRGVAQELNIKHEIRRVDIRAEAARKKISVEQAGRNARYRFFEEVRISAGAHVIATGHHKDDSLETLVLRILRGSSLTGLRGIPPVRGRIVRPLIEANRTEIIEFLEKERIPYRTDPTNLEAGTDRNFIRNRLFPVLRERFPDFAVPLHRTLLLAGEDGEFLDSEATRLYNRTIGPEQRGVVMEVPELAIAPKVLASRVILAALYNVSGPEVRWRRRHVQEILRMLRSANPSARMDLPGGLILQRMYGRLFLYSGGPAPAIPPIHVSVEGAGTVDIPQAGIGLRFRVGDRTAGIPGNFEGRIGAVFDADKVPFPLTVRSPIPGDRIRPWGMEGTRKLKNVLIDAKVPVRRRKGVPLLVKDDLVLWIPGIRRSREAPITPETRRVLEVTVIAYSNPTPDLL